MKQQEIEYGRTIVGRGQPRLGAIFVLAVIVGLAVLAGWIWSAS